MKAALKYILCLVLAAAPVLSSAQEPYVAPEVRISPDKVKVDGKIYYSHVVLEKQTLWSISRAYDVSVFRIIEANPTLNIASEGLKANQILLIPVAAPQTGEQVPQEPAAPSRTEAPAPQPAPAPVFAKPDEPVQAPAAADNAAPLTEAADSITTAPVDSTDIFEMDMPERVNIAVLLPLGKNGARNENNIDFYSGVLMAARDLGKKGVKVDLNLINTSDSLHVPVFTALHTADVIIGPINRNDISRMLKSVPAKRHLISPLDPKASHMADTCRIVQAPSTWEAQIREMVQWAKEEIQPCDSVVLVKESGVPPTESSKLLVSELEKAGIRFSTISYGILQGLKMPDVYSRKTSASGTTRYFIASENEAFVADAIRNANLMTYRNHDVTVYCPSKVRSFDLIDVETFHNVSLRLASTYFTDYSSPDVKSFVMAYRARFKAEPNSFAFQGYDTALYFASMCARYGRQWYKKLPECRHKGLQTDFKFEPTESAGQVNTAVRRVIYNKDFTVSVL